MSGQPLKTPPPKPLSFATRIPYRSPEWKFHTGIGRARSALSVKRYQRYDFELQRYREWACYGEIWQMTASGEWELIQVQEEGWR